MNRKMATWTKRGLFLAGAVGLCALVWIRSRDTGQVRAGLGRSFDFDLEQYQDVDPALILYDESDPIPLEMDTVTALAIGPQDSIYVGGDRALLLLSVDGRPRSRIELAGVPRCLAVDSDGTVYVGTGNRVEVFDAEGRLKAVWDDLGDDALPVSIALRGDDVFVGEARKACVLRYNRDGMAVDNIQGFVLFSSPILGIDVDAQQNLWVANPGRRELRSYDRDGVLVTQWSRPGRTIDRFSGCCNPVDIAVRADGNIVTTEKSIVRVKVVSPGGELVGIVAGPRSFDQGITALDVAVDSRGRVLVLDPVKKAVRVFVERGEVPE